MYKQNYSFNKCCGKRRKFLRKTQRQQIQKLKFSFHKFLLSYLDGLLAEGKVPTTIEDDLAAGLLDDLLCTLIANIHGTALKDSVFRCVYFHAPQRWPTAYLKSFANALLKVKKVFCFFSQSAGSRRVRFFSSLGFIL